MSARASAGRLPLMLAAAASALALAQACGAAPLYKVVGPDGKVTYTDQRPAAEGADALKGSATPGARAPSAAGQSDPASAAGAAYAMQLVVESGSRFCSTYVITSSRDVLKARAGWRERNIELLQKKNAVLRDTVGLPAMLSMSGKMERENEAVLQKLRQAPEAEQQKWCAAAPASFEAAPLDPSRNPTLVKTIMDYKVKTAL